MNMGIVLDKLYPGKIGGAEQYVRNIISIWRKNNNINMILFLNEYAMDSFRKEEECGAYRVSVPEKLNNAERYYEYYIAKYDIQVLFCPLFYIPYENCSVPMVSSILDIQYEYFPENFSEDLLEYRRNETRRTVNASSSIITISEFSKETIAEKLSVDRSEIYVTYLNADGSFDIALNEEKRKAIKEKLPEKYIFYPANGWPHKNHKRLIDAFDILKKEYHTDYKLVLTGNAFNGESKLKEYIISKGLEDEVVALGYIEQEDMPYVFRNAALLVFPSLFEGFGIPLVEAMRAGTPVACSNCGSIPEVAGDAALIFDANNAQDMADKINILVNDVELREKFRLKGYQRAKDFSWEKCAEETLYVLNKQIQESMGKKEFRVPKVTLIIPVFNDVVYLEETLASIAKQNYDNVEIWIACKDSRLVSKVTAIVQRFSLHLDIMLQNQLCKRLASMNMNDNGIVGIIQSGHILSSRENLEQIVVDFIQREEKIQCVMPVVEGFFGAVLWNEFESKRYERYLQFDKMSRSILFLCDEKRKLLLDIHYWFYGHYQEECMGIILRENLAAYQRKYSTIIDKSNLTNCGGVDYRSSLINIAKQNNYIPLSLINRTRFSQRILINKISRENEEVGKHYSQIRNLGIEFEGICSDGWMSRRCEIYVTLGHFNELIIKGEQIGLSGKPVLKIYINEQEIEYIKLENQGSFERRVIFPDNIEPGNYKLQLEVSKVFSAYRNNKNDARALSIRVVELSINNHNLLK